MRQTVVIDFVALSKSLLKYEELFIVQWIKDKQVSKIKPMLPAVTCSVQSTYLTGKLPNDHGIIANGWLFKEEREVKLWRQSNHLIKAPKIWDIAKKINPHFTCSNMFWWYNMYSNSDFNVTPRPQYIAHGQKKPDCYSKPEELRYRLQKKLGVFPLFNFWGPNTTIKSSKWIADASKLVHDWHEPTLQLVYLPHMDYVLQRHNDEKVILKNLKEIDQVFKDLIIFYESKGINPIVLSEYGINPVKSPIHVNRILRKKGYIKIREESGFELLDTGISQAFAIADHQVAHVYIDDKNKIGEIKNIFKKIPGINLVLDSKGKLEYNLNHKRSGDLILVANKDFWFTYYYWLEDKKAPYFARTVDIHRKPGYDPVELFTDPRKKMMSVRIVLKLLAKKFGFKTLLNIIPLDARLVKGSHGAIHVDKKYFPILIHTKEKNQKNKGDNLLNASEICGFILDVIFQKNK